MTGVQTCALPIYFQGHRGLPLFGYFVFALYWFWVLWHLGGFTNAWPSSYPGVYDGCFGSGCGDDRGDHQWLDPALVFVPFRRCDSIPTGGGSIHRQVRRGHQSAHGLCVYWFYPFGNGHLVGVDPADGSFSQVGGLFGDFVFVTGADWAGHEVQFYRFDRVSNFYIWLVELDNKYGSVDDAEVGEVESVYNKHESSQILVKESN